MTHERWKVQHLHNRTTNTKVIDRQQRQTHLPRKQREVLRYQHDATTGMYVEEAQRLLEGAEDAMRRFRWRMSRRTR